MHIKRAFAFIFLQNTTFDRKHVQVNSAAATNNAVLQSQLHMVSLCTWSHFGKCTWSHSAHGLNLHRVKICTGSYSSCRYTMQNADHHIILLNAFERDLTFLNKLTNGLIDIVTSWAAHRSLIFCWKFFAWSNKNLK